jgi:hypothetical protein
MTIDERRRWYWYWCWCQTTLKLAETNEHTPLVLEKARAMLTALDELFPVPKAEIKEAKPKTKHDIEF